MRLIFGHHSAIYRTDASGTSLDTITNTTAVSGIDFHLAKNQLFWSDVETRKVWYLLFDLWMKFNPIICTEDLFDAIGDLATTSRFQYHCST